MWKYFSLFLFGACAVSMQPPRPAEVWTLGILDGHRVSSYGPWGSAPGKKAAPGKAIDLQRHWPRRVFFPAGQQGETYPFVSLLAAAPAGGRFLANLGGLSNREDGPLILGNARTGDVLRTLPVSGAVLAAAFVPSDDPRVAVSWSDREGVSHAAIFDIATGKQVAELPAGRLPASRFLFATDPPRLLYLPQSPDGASHVELLPVDSWRSGTRLALPVENATILDLSDETILFETRNSIITVFAWAWTRPGAVPIVVRNREYGGTESVQYLLVNHGRGVLEWSDNAVRPSLLFDSNTGRPAGRFEAKSPVRAIAVHPAANTIALAVADHVVFIDASDGRVISRTAAFLSAHEDISLFWFR